MTRPLKFKNALLCEYVAMGDRGKYTLVNVLAGDLTVESFGGQMPLAFYGQLEIEPGAPAPDLDLFVAVDDRRLAQIQLKNPVNNKAAVMVIAIPHIEIQISQPCRLSFTATSEGYDDTVVIAVSINGPPASNG